MTYDSNYSIAQAINAVNGGSNLPFDSAYSIGKEIYKTLGGSIKYHDSTYSILLDILNLLRDGKHVRIYYNTSDNTPISNTFTQSATSTGSDELGFYLDFDVLETIPENAMRRVRSTGGGKLYDVKIFGGTKTIEKNAFEGNDSLNNIYLPEGLQTIGEKAFSRIAGVGIVIPNSVSAIRNEAFYLSTMQNIFIGENTLYIGNEAFVTYEPLHQIILNNKQIINSNVFGTSFYTNSNTTKLYVRNEDYDYYSDSAYSYVKLIKPFILVKYKTTDGEILNLNGTVYILNVYNYYDGECLAAFPENYLGSVMMSNKSTLSEIILEDTVTSIGSETFSGDDNLILVTIPSSVTSIDSDAFLGATSLEEIIYLGTMAAAEVLFSVICFENLTTVHCLDGDLTFEAGECGGEEEEEEEEEEEGGEEE